MPDPPPKASSLPATNISTSATTQVPIDEIGGAQAEHEGHRRHRDDQRDQTSERQ